MLDLIKDLFLVIQAIAGYPMPDALPAVHVLADREVQQMACGRPCFVKAFYDPAKGVVLAESVDFMHDPYGRSILLHELVHHAQRVSGRFDAARTDCERRNAEEYEAYDIQNRYLDTQRDPRRIPLRILSLKCE